jgi:hypothetical protein
MNIDSRLTGIQRRISGGAEIRRYMVLVEAQDQSIDLSKKRDIQTIDRSIRCWAL